MKNLVIVFFTVISAVFSQSCYEAYNRPENEVEKIQKNMTGKYVVSKFHLVTYDPVSGKILSDTSIENLCTFTLYPADYHNSDPFPSIVFENTLVEYSSIIRYFSQAINPIPSNYSGTSSIYWDPDSYEKRINLWAIIALGSLHKIINREKLSGKKEKWWYMSSEFLEEWEITKID